MTAPGAGLAPTRARVQSAASVNATLVKAGPGSISDITVANNAGTVAYMRLYDLGRAPLSTDTPFETLILAANGVQTVYAPPNGCAFANGLAYDITTGAADTDQTATAANQVAGQINYY